MQHFSAERYLEAKESFNSLDLIPAELTSQQRTTMWQTMREIDQAIHPAFDAASLLVEAEKAAKGDQLTVAAEMYGRLMNHESASAEQKQLALARLAEVKRKLEPKKAAMRREIDAADLDLQAGRLDDASRRLMAVKDIPVDLGWFDNQRINRLLTVLDERRQKMAALVMVAVEEPVQPAPVEESEQDQSVARTIEAMPTDDSSALAAATGPEESAPVTDESASDKLLDALELYAQQAMAEGALAEKQGQYHVAAEYYKKATELDQANEQALEALAQAQLKIQGMSSDGGPMSDQIKIDVLRIQKVKAEYSQMMNTARSHQRGERYQNALEAVQQAKTVLDKNQQLLPSAEYRQLRQAAEELDNQLDVELRNAEAISKAEAERDKIIQQDKQRVRANRQKQLDVHELLTTAMELRKEQLYDQSLAKIEQALFRDRNNEIAEALKSIVEIERATVTAKRYEDQRGIAITEHMLDNREATIPRSELLRYPPDWPAITQRRMVGSGLQQEDRANRAVKRKLESTVEPIDFETEPLKQVLDHFQQLTEVNIFVNWSALRDAGIDEDTTIDLNLTAVSAGKALDFVLRQISTDLDPITRSIRDGIMEISTRRDLTSNTTLLSYDIQDLLIQVPRFSNAPQFDLNNALSNTQSGGSGTGTGGGGGGGGSGSGQGIFDEDEEDDDMELPTRLELVDNLSELIRNTVGQPDEWMEFGGDVSSLRELNGTLIVRTTLDNHAEINGLLNELRRTRAIQIHVEARFLLVDQNFLEEVGADLDVVITNVGRHFGPIVLSQDTFGITSAPTTGLPGGFIDASGGGTPVAGSPEAVAGIANQQSGSGRSLDLNLSYIDDLQADLIIRATQAHRRSISLTAPRLTLMNGQRAFVSVFRQLLFISDLEPISDAVGFDPTLSVTQSGVALDVEATVSSDRRYVTMTVRPSLATVVQPIRQIAQRGVFQVNQVLGGGGATDDQDQMVIVEAFVEAPEIELTEIRTTVNVPDKGTLLMGGQRLVGEAEVEAGVPILSKIPFLNRLTTNRSTVKDERTLLILVKPTIIITSEEEDINFPGLLDNPAEYNAALQYKY